jgi:hypothetical protein
MNENTTLWGLRRESRFNKVDVWYGYWLSRSDALGYMTREAGGVGDGGELASMHAEWFTVEPIEWVDGRDTNLKVKNRPWVG